MKKMLFTRKAVLFLSIALAVAGLSAASLAHNPSEREGPYEVWILDQSDTTADGGGTLYIYQDTELEGEDPSAATPEVIDLGGAARDLCLEESGSAPRRPHMLFFNHDQTHAIISFVTTGHVLFMNTATRQPIACIDVGEQAHAAVPSPDDRY